VSDVLARICADKREHIADRQRAEPLAVVERTAAAAPPCRGFADRLAEASAEGYGLIAEIKKASPSEGVLREDFDPARLALAYEAGGAACLSVLTDTPYFQGRDQDLVEARGAACLPVLRKDFTLDPYQVIEARALGADAILIILACVDDALAADLAQTAAALGMDALVEVHDEAELDRALALPCRLVGINNRDLKTLGTDLATAEALAPRVPEDRIVVAESGLHTPADLERMAKAGARCFLIGTSLMRETDVTAATRALLGLPEYSEA